MLVRRVIEREVTCCGHCPYYGEERDMGATIPYCKAIDDHEDYWANVLQDISWRTAHDKISSQCPLQKQNEKMKDEFTYYCMGRKDNSHYHIADNY